MIKVTFCSSVLYNFNHCCCNCSVTQLCPNLCDPMDCSTPGFPVLPCLLEFAQTHVLWVVMLSNHLILCHPPSPLPSFFPSIKVFINESALCIMWPKYCSFSFTTQPSNEYSGLISFRIDWFDLLAVQGALKSLFLAPQFKSINSAALSPLYGPTLISIRDYWKTIALTIWLLVGKVMSLLFNMMSRFVIVFFFPPKEEVSFNFVAEVAIHSGFGAQENKICHCFHFFPYLFAMKWWDRMPGS